MSPGPTILRPKNLARRGFVAKAALLSGLGWVGGASALSPSDPLSRTSAQTFRSQGALLLDLALAGKRLVAVGERGIVLVSDDGGQHWQQASVPVSVTLTAVDFPTASLGWAVGHGGVVLHSDDAGSTWRVQLDGRRAAQIELDAALKSGEPARLQRARGLVADGADKPLLDLHFEPDGRRGIVIGAYGLIFATQDGGASWQSWIGQVENPKGLHLNAVYVAGSSVFLGGEQGLLLRSTDSGASFSRLRSPYEGSWFAMTGLGGELLVAAGLRGNVWTSIDRGASFQQSAVPVPVSIAAAVRASEGQILLVNQAGMVLASNDRGHSFPTGHPFIVNFLLHRDDLADGSLVASTLNGPLRLPAPVAGPAVATR